MNAADSRHWTYLPYGPFASLADYRAWMESFCTGDASLFYAVIDLASGRAVGVAGYLRISPEYGTIEIGHIQYSPLLQRTIAATECMFLMMARVFDELGYRRYEWKCNALNRNSIAAARRLGFAFEGIHRQARISKGRNRDTAWFSILDHEWPAIKTALQTWLAPENFDADGRQKRRLSALTRAAMQGGR